MNIEQLVPPLELCRQIPKGAFADSAFCWVEYPRGDLSKAELFPAPTLAEIIERIGDHSKVSVCRASRVRGEWRVSAQNERGNCAYSLYLEDNPAAAALRLWLEVEAG